MRPSLRANLNTYVTAVIAAGVMALALAVINSWGQPVLGTRPVAFVVFGMLVFAAEAFPITWLSGQDGGQTTASWAFVFAMMFIGPTSSGLVVTITACVAIEVLQRHHSMRTAFNAMQLCLSLATGTALMSLIAEPTLIASGRSPTLGWLMGALVAGSTAFALNSLFTCVALALSKRLPVWSVIRESIGVNLAMDALLIALAPVFAVVAVHGIILVPLLLIAAVGIYLSAKIALGHRHEATHDLLTELPNRRLFYDQSALAIEKAAASRRSLAVLLLDLDGFKGINDRLGHAVGDIVLREVAMRLEGVRLNGDLVARLGGDEFAILMTGDPDLATAQRFANNVVSALEAPLSIEGVPVAVAGSAGMAMFPQHGEDVDTLLRHADTAMYRAKTGPARALTYDDRQDRHGPTRLGLLSELSRAIEDEQLFVLYQPKIALATGQLTGAEALVRWHHPQRGLIVPDSFMPGAEQTELMGPLTGFVLRKAIEQAARWQAEGIEITVAVNASARNLRDTGFPALVRSILRDAGVAGSILEIEITENTVMTDPARTAAVLEQLRMLGVGLSIDDFGTGYSSLAHLRTLPIDCVKIDRTFISNMSGRSEDVTIVRSIIDLARNLGLGTIGEGIETAEVLSMLTTMGCDSAQGYYIARPGTAEEVTALHRMRSSPILVTDGGER